MLKKYYIYIFVLSMLNTAITPSILDFCEIETQILEIVDLGEEEEKKEKKLGSELQVKIVHNAEHLDFSKFSIEVSNCTIFKNNYKSITQAFPTPPPEIA